MKINIEVSINLIGLEALFSAAAKIMAAYASVGATDAHGQQLAADIAQDVLDAPTPTVAKRRPKAQLVTEPAPAAPTAPAAPAAPAAAPTAPAPTAPAPTAPAPTAPAPTPTAPATPPAPPAPAAPAPALPLAQPKADAYTSADLVDACKQVLTRGIGPEHIRAVLAKRPASAIPAAEIEGLILKLNAL